MAGQWGRGDQRLGFGYHPDIASSKAALRRTEVAETRSHGDGVGTRGPYVPLDRPVLAEARTESEGTDPVQVRAEVSLPVRLA